MITVEELKTHIYSDNAQAITGGDDTILLAAIDGAIEEARGYLAAYDCDKVFAAKGTERHGLLLIFIKDIATWHFLTLSNVGADLEFRRFRYERAVDWLKQVQRGNVSPNIPILDKDEDGAPDTGAIYKYGSNPKRSQHF